MHKGHPHIHKRFQYQPRVGSFPFANAVRRVQRLIGRQRHALNVVKQPDVAAEIPVEIRLAVGQQRPPVTDNVISRIRNINFIVLADRPHFIYHQFRLFQLFFPFFVAQRRKSGTAVRFRIVVTPDKRVIYRIVKFINIQHVVRVRAGNQAFVRHKTARQQINPDPPVNRIKNFFLRRQVIVKIAQLFGIKLGKPVHIIDIAAVRIHPQVIKIRKAAHKNVHARRVQLFRIHIPRIRIPGDFIPFLPEFIFQKADCRQHIIVDNVPLVADSERHQPAVRLQPHAVRRNITARPADKQRHGNGCRRFHNPPHTGCFLCPGHFLCTCLSYACSLFRRRSRGFPVLTFFCRSRNRFPTRSFSRRSDHFRHLSARIPDCFPLSARPPALYAGPRHCLSCSKAVTPVPAAARQNLATPLPFSR